MRMLDYKCFQLSSGNHIFVAQQSNEGQDLKPTADITCICQAKEVYDYLVHGKNATRTSRLILDRAMRFKLKEEPRHRQQ